MLIVGCAPKANVIHCALARDPDGIPQGGDGVERTLFLRRVTEEALRVTRCGTIFPFDFVVVVVVAIVVVVVF